MSDPAMHEAKREIAERRAKVSAMSMAGDSAETIAAELGVARRTVERDREALGLVGVEKPCRGGRYSRGCRCDLCRARRLEYQRRWKARRQSGDVVGSFEHGKSAYENYGCRCELCREGHRERMRIQYRRRVERLKAAANGGAS